MRAGRKTEEDEDEGSGSDGIQWIVRALLRLDFDQSCVWAVIGGCSALVSAARANVGGKSDNRLWVVGCGCRTIPMAALSN